MSDPIKEGDLVMIVKPMPCGHGTPGLIFRVGGIEAARSGKFMCKHCKYTWTEGMIARFDVPTPRSDGISIWRLKRIPPLSELGDVEHNEEITA